MGFDGVGFQLFLELSCLRMIYHIQKDSLDAQNRQNVWLLISLLVREAFDPVRMGPQGDFCLNNNNNNDKI